MDFITKRIIDFTMIDIGTIMLLIFMFIGIIDLVLWFVNFIKNNFEYDFDYEANKVYEQNKKYFN